MDHALSFLGTWSALDQAAHLVLTRADELNGDLYEILAPAAAALEAKHPLAATVLRRALIDFALEQNRTKRYQHAARNLKECASLAERVEDFGRFETAARLAPLRCRTQPRACERNAKSVTKAAVYGRCLTQKHSFAQVFNEVREKNSP